METGQPFGPYELHGDGGRLGAEAMEPSTEVNDVFLDVP